MANRRYVFPAVTAAAVLLEPIMAQAAVPTAFNFFLDGPIIKGEILFGDANGKLAPTGLELFKPGMILPANAYPSSPFDIWAIRTHTSGSFSLSQGKIVAASFKLSAHSGSNAYKLKFDWATGTNQFTKNGTLTFGNQSGFDTIVFQSIPVPEPTSIALLGAGLAGISTFRRRRRAAA